MKHPEGGMVVVRNMSIEERDAFFKKTNVKRFCCKRMYLSAVNFTDILLEYDHAKSTLNKNGTAFKIFN
jgi:hypothetical protein